MHWPSHIVANIVTLSTSCHLPAFGEFYAFGKSTYASVDRIALLFEFSTHIPKPLQGYGKGFDELAFFERRLRILVLWEGHIDGDVNHLKVCVAEAGIY
jgi:hypothetical protein